MAYKGDMGTEDLDQLIHSYEYENQNFIKMIEQENQLIKALATQIEESTEDTKRMEIDISLYEEETQRLQKQCTINKVNIESQKKTRGLMCDHEAALLKKLEFFKLETAEKQKFFKENIVKYTDIRDDHMRKYRCFPLAIELEMKKGEVLSVQELVSQSESTKTILKQMVAAKEDDLDSKVMSRIIVKIAKAKLRTFQLEKEIQECLHERDDLLKQVEDVSQGEQSAQTNDSEHQHNEEIPMDTGDESSVPKNSRAIPQSNEKKSAQKEEQAKFSFVCVNDQNMLDEENELCESASCFDQSSDRRQKHLMPTEISEQTAEQYGSSDYLNSTAKLRDESGTSVNVLSSFTACQVNQPLRKTEACTHAVYSEKMASSTFPRLTPTPRHSQANFTRSLQQPLLVSQKAQPTSTNSTNLDQSHHTNITALSRLPVPCFGKSTLLKNKEKQVNVDIKQIKTSFFHKFNLPQIIQPPRQTCTPLARQPYTPLARQPCTPLVRQTCTLLTRQPCTLLARSPSTTLVRQPHTPLPRQDLGQIEQPKAPNLQHNFGQHKKSSPGPVQQRQGFQSFLPRFSSNLPPQTNTTASASIKEMRKSSSTSMFSNAQPSVRLAPSMSLTQKTEDSTGTAASVSLPMKQDKTNGEKSKQNQENNCNGRSVEEEPSQSFKMLVSNVNVTEANEVNSVGDLVLQDQSHQENEPLFKLNIDQTKPVDAGGHLSQTSGKRSSQGSQAFDLGSYFGHFDASDSDDENRPALYNLFKFSGKSKDSTKDEENANSAVFTLGTFMENESDSSEVEQATFLNFSCSKTAGSGGHANQGFSLNFASEIQNSDDNADEERPKFKLFDLGTDF